MNVLRRRGVVVFALFAALAVTGIAVRGAARAGGQREVEVRLSEWHVEPKPTTVAAGKVQFVVENAGYATHELVVVRGANPSALPTNANGSVDLSQIARRDRVGEVADIASKATKKITVTLTAGTYVLFCNVVDGEDPSGRGGFSHFAERMVSTMTVTK